MHADAAQVPARIAAVRGRWRRARLDLDGRSATAKRINKLVALFTAELGGEDAVSPTMALKVRRAAELVVTTEEMRASTLSSEHPPTDLAMLALVRLEGIADRAVRRLGIDDRRREPGGDAGLATLMAAAAQEAQEGGAVPSPIAQNEPGAIPVADAHENAPAPTPFAAADGSDEGSPP
jgi:hypothetical protein